MCPFFVFLIKKLLCHVSTHTYHYCYCESDKTSLEDLKAMLPHDLFDYCKEHQLLDHAIQTCEPSSSKSDNDNNDCSDVHSFPPSDTTIPSPPPLLNDDDYHYYNLPYLSTVAAAAAAAQYEHSTTHYEDPPMAINNSNNNTILDPTTIQSLPPFYPTSSEQV